MKWTELKMTRENNGYGRQRSKICKIGILEEGNKKIIELQIYSKVQFEKTFQKHKKN